MAKYRQKSEEEILWNRIRRRLVRELDTQIQDWREEAVNKLLPEAFERFSAAFARGEILELEPEYERWVTQALDDHIPPALLSVKTHEPTGQ